MNDQDVTNYIGAGQMKWRLTFGILCDKVSRKLKGVIYKVVVGRVLASQELHI